MYHIVHVVHALGSLHCIFVLQLRLLSTVYATAKISRATTIFGTSIVNFRPETQLKSLIIQNGPFFVIFGSDIGDSVSQYE